MRGVATCCLLDSPLVNSSKLISCTAVGDVYPTASVTGLDLSPIQPNYVPENVHFFVDDFEEEWVDDEDKFDFIHVRHTIHSIRDRPTLLRRIFKYAYCFPLISPSSPRSTNELTKSSPPTT